MTPTRSVRVAVIGAGMAGRAHAFGYRSIDYQLFPQPASVELVAAVDANIELAEQLGERFGFERVGTRWEDVVEASDIDAVSVVLPNYEHREVVTALLRSGKHVLCEKPLAHNAKDAFEMAAAADVVDQIDQVGFNHRQTPAVAAIRDLVLDGKLGRPLEIFSHYWSDHGLDPDVPYSWRHDLDLAGGGSTVDLGSHILDSARFICGDIRAVRGAKLGVAIPERPIAVGVTTGHQKTETSGGRREVTTDDYAVFTAEFENGCVGTFSTSRVAPGFKNSSGFTLLGAEGAAIFDWERLGEFAFAAANHDPKIEGFTRVVLGPQHPYLADGLVMPVAGVGHGLADTFVFEVYEFVKAIATGKKDPDVADFQDGYANALVLDAVKMSHDLDGAEVSVSQLRTEVERGNA